MANLKDRVALVTGASRGAGRGIACALGEAGATVYVTGRTARGGVPSTANRKETVDETAEIVTSRGGHGIAVRCDNSSDADVRALLERIRADHGRLDILVNNAWGGYEGKDEMLDFGVRFWSQPFEKRWQGMFLSGLRAHMLTTWHALPLILPQKRGLVVCTIAWAEGGYLGNLFYDVSKFAIARFVSALSEELRRHQIAAIAVAPGWMRTEKVLEYHVPRKHDLSATESTEYVGRCIVSLASDADVMQKSGKVFLSGELAREYGFTDVDGRRVPPFRVRLVVCPRCQGAGTESDGSNCKQCLGLGQFPMQVKEAAT